MPFFTCALPATALLFASPSSFASGTVQASSTPVLSRTRDAGAVRVAYRKNFVPFSFYDADEKLIGYVMDLRPRVVSRLCTDLRRPDLKV